MNGGATVFVIGADANSRQKTSAVAESLELPVEWFVDGDEFLKSSRGACHGCLILALSGNGARFDGLVREMQHKQIALPTIVIAAHPRTATTVQWMKRGALTVLDKSFEEHELRAAVLEAIQVSEAERSRRIDKQIVLGRIAQLNESERKVLHLMIDGMANKVIAKRLNVSVRTVESRRHEVFAKMQVKSIAELVRTVVASSALSTF